jgi:CHASE2 domain-containing sensor protein
MKKPLHKHIGHQARRIGRHVTKYLYKRDTFFATVWVFVFIVVLGSIPINFYALNPLKLGLKDFDFHDLSYSKLEVHKDTNERKITIINIGKTDREGLAMLIEKAAAFQPKVMGLDVLFDGHKDPYQDSILSATLARYPQLVLASQLIWKDESDPYKENFFKTPANDEGYVNMLADDVATVRLWSPSFENEKNHHAEPYPSFALTILKKYDSVAYQRQVKRKKTDEIINYTRRINQYQVIQPEDLLTDNVLGERIKDRIVLFGYVNTNTDDIEDKKFTPMNERFYGKSIPDMNGIVIHANILSMALENNYIRKLPGWFNWFFAVLIGWIHMAIFIKYYLDHHIWFHLVAKIAQLISAILFVYAGIWLFENYRIKLDMKYTLYVIIMAVDVIYFYEAWATWMHKKFHYHTVFGHHGHGPEPAHPKEQAHPAAATLPATDINK